MAPGNSDSSAGLRCARFSNASRQAELCRLSSQVCEARRNKRKRETSHRGYSPRRTTFVGAFSIGIDFDEFAHGASGSEVTTRWAEITKSLNRCRVILGVDRLDYTKGIPERLAAYRHLLEFHPEMRQRITLVQVVVASREDIPKYFELKSQIERSVSEINGHYGDPSWVPIHDIHRSLDRPELLAYYRAADIALITPLKDGMNLVAKEYCAARVNNDGALILSEFAGAAFQLRGGALLVNPYDTRAVAEAIETAYEMPATEQKKRIRKLKACVRRENSFRWRESYWSCGELRAQTSAKGTVRCAEIERHSDVQQRGGKDAQTDSDCSIGG